jgi:transcriptional regulator ATRX
MGKCVSCCIDNAFHLTVCNSATNQKTRQGWVERFNDEHNKRARLFVISTKAGGIGVNLVAASRVVVFDAAWNPALDSQVR